MKRYTLLTEKRLNNHPQKSKKINSNKKFHEKTCFAALCSEVVFLHIRKNLNEPTSFSNVFMWDMKIVGQFVNINYQYNC